MRAGGFELVDEEGRVRARLGMAADGGVALDLADEDGMVRATVTVEPEGGSDRPTSAPVLQVPLS